MRSLVLIPSYNTGPRLLRTVEEALRYSDPVWVVVDGSTDGSERPVEALAGRDARVRVIRRPSNGGKGSAVLTGVAAALGAGYTHAVAVDADGQHPSDQIPVFLAAARAQPDAMILGRPVFGPEAPKARLYGRKLSVAMTRLEILGPGIDDPLFGFRIYPLEPLRQAFAATRWARGYDFDQEVVVRMFWNGTPTVNLPAACRYLRADEGGISHFRYLRDNAKLVWLQLRLLAELAVRWPQIVSFRRRLRVAGLALALLVVFLRPLAGATAPVPPDPEIPAGDAGWQALFTALAPHGDRRAHFVEERYFPFRTGPVELTGTVRISPERGMSLQYATPDPRVMIVDRQGILLRDRSGRDHAGPGDSRVRASADSLMSALRFDLPDLRSRYQLHGFRQGDQWRVDLVPQTAGQPTVVLAGHAAMLDSIELVTTAKQRVQIQLSDHHDGESFSAADLKRYFRT